MSVDCGARAGYGVKVVSCNIQEEFLEKFYSLDMVDFLEEVLGEFQYTETGSYYTGDTTYYIVFPEQDVVRYPKEFEMFRNNLQNYKHIFKDVEPKWFCDVLWN